MFLLIVCTHLIMPSLTAACSVVRAKAPSLSFDLANTRPEANTQQSSESAVHKTKRRHPEIAQHLQFQLPLSRAECRLGLHLGDTTNSPHLLSSEDSFDTSASPFKTKL